jgi:hypothetical protein
MAITPPTPKRSPRSARWKRGQPADHDPVRPAGPKLRVGTFREGRAVIRHSGHFTLDRNPEPGDETRVCLPHPELFGILEKGQRLLIDDGKLRLRVIRADKDAILCSAEVGGVISDRKGVNVPDAVVPVPARPTRTARSGLRGGAWRGLDRAVVRAAAGGRGRGAPPDGRIRFADGQDREAGGDLAAGGSSSFPTASWWRAATWAWN